MAGDFSDLIPYYMGTARRVVAISMLLNQIVVINAASSSKVITIANLTINA
jgi:hypothetical protein